MKGLETLKSVALRIADLDTRITEVFIHNDSPRDPFVGDEISLVCHVADPAISRDEAAYEEEGYQWELNMSEAAQPIAKESGLKQALIVTPFNFEMHASGEYGQYYATLYLKEGYQPILEMADQRLKEQREQLIDGEWPEEELDTEQPFSE